MNVNISGVEAIGNRLVNDILNPKNQLGLFDDSGKNENIDNFRSRRLKILEAQNPGKIILAFETLNESRLRAMCLGADIDYDAYTEVQKECPLEDHLTRRLDEVKPEDSVKEIEMHYPSATYIGSADGYAKIFADDFLQIRSQLISIAKWEPATLLR